MRAKHIGEYLDSDDRTSRLVPQAAMLLAVRRRLCAALPDDLRRSCAIANYKQGVVVLFAGNNAVAAKLRLLAPKLIEQLDEPGREVTAIEIRVQVGSSFVMQVIEKKALALSGPASEALARLSRNLPDGRLKRAVGALARRGR